MSVKLNKTRTRDSRLVAIAVVLAVACSYGALAPGSVAYAATIYAGYGCIAVCMLGRIYATAFIGGFQNKRLIAEGPFSVTRNPLYLFSFIGMAGVGLTSARLSVLIPLLGTHLVSYHFLIRREEAGLARNFGEDYAAYCASVPRLLPRLSLLRTPETITLRPRVLYFAIRDSSVWLLAFPFFRLIDHLHASGMLPAWFLLP